MRALAQAAEVMPMVPWLVQRSLDNKWWVSSPHQWDHRVSNLPGETSDCCVEEDEMGSGSVLPSFLDSFQRGAGRDLQAESILCCPLPCGLVWVLWLWTSQPCAKVHRRRSAPRGSGATLPFSQGTLYSHGDWLCVQSHHSPPDHVSNTEITQVFHSYFVFYLEETEEEEAAAACCIQGV